MKNAINSNLDVNAGWFVWGEHTRSRSMANLLEVPLYELKNKGHFLIRYPVLVIRTLFIVRRKNIKVLYVQNPSIVLSFISIFIRKVMVDKLIIDSHNAGIFPLEGRSNILNFVAKKVVENSDITIVTNKYLGQIVQGWGGEAFIMPDPIPEIGGQIPKWMETGVSDKPYILFICAWAEDEPFNQVIDAASGLGEVCDVYITGDYRKKISPDEANNLPKNIKLLGFIAYASYITYLTNALGSIDLTLRDNCLVCGAYESIALLTPCIVSDWKVNRDTFKLGFIYSKNDSDSIETAILTLIKDSSLLATEIQKEKEDHFHRVTSEIDNLNCKVRN